MRKQLYRTKKNSIIAGVASGLAEYFEIDAVIVRAIFIITALAWGTSIVIYIILWIIIPREKQIKEEQPEMIDETLFEAYEIERQNKRENRRIAAGIFLIILGGFIFIDKIFPWFDLGNIWPVILIILGILVLLKLPSRTNNNSNINL